MIRLMKADFYRLFRTKGFYIILLAVITFVVGNVSSESVGTIGVQSETVMESQSQTNVSWNIAVALTNASFSSGVLVYLFIAFFVIIIGYEFSQRTYKNTLTSGVSRISFVFSKYFTQVTALLLGTFLYFGTTALIAFFKYGTDGIHTGEVLKDALIAMLSLSFCISVIFSLGTLVLFLTTSNIIASIFILVYPISIQLIYTFIEWEGLKYFDFFSLAQTMGQGLIAGTELIPYIFVSLATIAITLVGSAFVIRHKEL